MDVALKMFEALSAKDNAAQLACMDENIVLRVPGTRPFAGTFHGHEGVARFTEGSRAATDDGEHIEIVDMLQSDSRVAAIIKLNATFKGKTLDDPTLHLMKVENEKITEYWVYPFEQAKVDQFWLD